MVSEELFANAFFLLMLISSDQWKNNVGKSSLTTGESFDMKIIVVIIPSKLVSYKVLLIPLLSFSYNHDQKSNFLHVGGLVTKIFV